MLAWLRSQIGMNMRFWSLVEVTFVGLFFIQALRYLVGTLYARFASASLYPALDPNLIDPNLPGLIEPATMQNELMFLAYMLALPLLTVLFGRFRMLMFVSVIITALGRYLMVGDESISPAIAAAIAVGGGLFYLAMLIRHRARLFPYFFLIPLGLDQAFRAFGDTRDPSWDTQYAQIQMVLSLGIGLLAVFIALREIINQGQPESPVEPQDRGTMSLWGGLGLGALLFLELSLLALPNAAARRADTSYTLMVPLIMVATLLPIIPAVRGQARRFIGLFDGALRGWVWMLLAMLLLVLGTRLEGVVAGVGLALAQFCISLVWWWMVRPRAEKERSFSGLWIVIGVLVFALLIVFDTFTYEYAFVRDFSPEFDFLNPIVPPLLRGFKGLGLAVIILAVFIGMLPMTQVTRRIAWNGGPIMMSLVTTVVVWLFAGFVVWVSRPPVVTPLNQPDVVRIGTYNIHAGFNEFFYSDMDAIALTIQQSGANVVLLQEVEAGRLSSFGVDQALWLGRHLGMDVRFYPTNENLQGLAVLSKIEIVFDDGVLLDSQGSQTGLQRVQVRPDESVITVYNTWLDPLLDTRQGNRTLEELEASQQTQLTEVFEIIAAHHQPSGQLLRTVIGGTFNNIPDSDLVRRMPASGFVDHFAGDPIELAATFWRTGTMARLDYLWTNRVGNFRAIGTGVVNTHASDHRLAFVAMQMQ